MKILLHIEPKSNNEKKLTLSYTIQHGKKDFKLPPLMKALLLYRENVQVINL